MIAVEHLERELDEPLSADDRADALCSLGEMLGDLGDAKAVDALTEAVALLRVLGDDGELCATLSSLAEQELRRANAVDAARHQREALRFATEAAMPQLIACAFILAARLAEPAGADEMALRLHALADAMLEEIGFTLVPSDQALSDEVLERIRLRFGEERYGALTISGRQLDLQTAIGLAEEIFERTIERAGDSSNGSPSAVR